MLARRFAAASAAACTRAHAATSRPLVSAFMLSRGHSANAQAPFGGRAMSTGKVFIVCSNPIGESFSNAIADSVEKGLANGGKEVRRINLYQMPNEIGGGQFEPLLSFQERKEYFNENEQTVLKADPHVKYIVQSLRWCDSLVLIYPTWWFNIPAILKGFFDRCFIPGVGFKYDPVAQKRDTGLKNIQKVGTVTTYGFTEEEVTKAGDAGRVMIVGAMPMLFSPSCKVEWNALYGMQGAQPKEVRTKFLADLEAAYAKW